MTKAFSWTWVVTALLAVLLFASLLRELTGYLFWLAIAVGGLGIWKIASQRPRLRR